MSESSGSTDGQGNGEAGLGNGLNGDSEPAVSESATGAASGAATAAATGGNGQNNLGTGAGDGAGNGAAGRGRHRKRAIGIAVIAVAVETAWLWQRGYRVGGNVIVRCRDGHLFTTIWLPGISLKSLRLGFWRFQYCPVGKHWSLVIPAKRSGLTAAELQAASAQRDIRIP